MRPELTVREFLASLREGPYTSLGSYPKFWLASDGETLSYAACLENVWQIARAIRDNDNGGWRVVACDANWEDPRMHCAHTGERIESAYAESKADLCEGTRVRVSRHVSEPGQGLMYQAFTGTLTEWCNGEGWDVVTVLLDDGSEQDCYSFDVERA